MTTLIEALCAIVGSASSVGRRSRVVTILVLGNFCTAAAMADPISLAPNPNGGTITAAPGDTLVNDDASGTFTNNGRIEVQASGSLRNPSAQELLNRGEIDNGGQFDNEGTLNNIDTDNNDALITNHNVFNQSGTFLNDDTFINIGTLNNAGPLNNSGLIENDGTINNTAVLKNFDRVLNRGTIDNFGGLYNDTTVDSGHFVNEGTIVNDEYFENANGLLTNSGTITNNLWMVNRSSDGLVNTGIIRNSAGADFLQDGSAPLFDNQGWIENDGLFKLLSGALVNSMSIVNSGEMVLLTTTENSGTITNMGELSAGPVSNTGTIDNQASFLSLGLENFDELLNSGSFISEGTLHNYANLTNLAGGTLTLASGSNFFNLDLTDGDALFTNYGIVNNDIDGDFGFINGNDIVNDGIFHNSGILTNSSFGDALFENNGTLNNVSVFSNESEFINRGLFVNDGLLDNDHAGAVLTNEGTIINNFSIENRSGAFVNSGTITNNLFMTLNSSAEFRNEGTVVNSTSGEFMLDAALENSGTIENMGWIRATGPSATIDSSGTFVSSGALTSLGIFTNSGAVEITSTGTYLAGGSYTQTAGETIIDGLLQAETVQILAGSLGGEGTIQSADVQLGVDAVLAPGGAAGSTGQLLIDGSLDAYGLLSFDIFDLFSFDSVAVTGTADFFPGSGFLFDITGGYDPQGSDSFDFFSATALFGWESSAFSIIGYSGDLDYSIDSYTDGSMSWLRLSFLADNEDPTSVPAPPTWPLLVTGLLLLLRFQRKPWCIRQTAHRAQRCG